MRRIVCAVAFVLALPLGAQRFDTLVKNAGVPRHAGVARLISEVTIGGAEATSDEYLFTSIRFILAANDGSVWIIDRAQSIGKSGVRRYANDGKFIRSVSRRGDGPGEWNMPSMLAQLRDGRVLLRDNVVGRPLSFFKPNGDYDTAWSYPTSTILSVAVDTSDVIWMRRMAGVTLHSAGPLVTERLRPNGKVVDTIAQPARILFEGENTSLTPAYRKSGLSAWSPLGYYVQGATTKYAVNLLLPRTLPNNTIRPWRQGDRVLSIRNSVPAVLVSAEERKDYLVYLAYLKARLDASGRTQPGSFTDFPRVKQPIHSISIDVEGRVWVGVTQPSERFEPPPVAPIAGRPQPPVIRWRAPLVYDIFEPSGTYVGRVKLPFDVQLNSSDVFQARGDTVWGVATDDDGVESVVRYRIVWP